MGGTRFTVLIVAAAVVLSVVGLPSGSVAGATDVAPLATSADLSVSKTDQPDPVDAGGEVTYTITVTNFGPDAAENVLVTDTLQGGTILFTQTTQGFCSPGGSMAICDLGTVSAGATVTVFIHAQAGAPGTMTDTAEVASTVTSDPDPSDNTDTETTTVRGEADLSVSKSDDPDPVEVGGVVTYTVVVSNAGPDPSEQVVLSDTLEGGTISDATATQGACVAEVTTVVCAFGTVGPGQTVTVTIHALPGQPGSMTDTASVASAVTPDPDPFNNVDTETTTVVSTAECRVTGGGFLDAPKRTFGLSARAKSGVPAGHVTYQDHDADLDMNSTQITGVGCRGSMATITGTGVVDGVTITFTVRVDDRSEPGTADTFSIVWPGYAATGTLGGGNIQVRSG